MGPDMDCRLREHQSTDPVIIVFKMQRLASNTSSRQVAWHSGPSVDHGASCESEVHGITLSCNWDLLQFRACPQIPCLPANTKKQQSPHFRRYSSEAPSLTAVTPPVQRLNAHVQLSTIFPDGYYFLQHLQNWPHLRPLHRCTIMLAEQLKRGPAQV